VNPKLLPDLLIFLEVARSGSISKAARRLHTVQTNVSARMQKLEAALGGKLLTRTARGIDLTAAGEALLPVARRLDSLLSDVGQVFPTSSVRPPALIRIGSLETFAATHMAKLIASYKTVDPRVEFAISSGSSRSLMHMLQENELDAASAKLHAKDPLANGDSPLIVQRQACSYSERYLNYLNEKNLSVPRTIEAGSIEALLGLVEQGLGIAVAPRTLINSSVRKIRIIPLTPLGAKRWISIHLIVNQRAPALKRFVEHCRECFTGVTTSPLTAHTKT
jgi:DNA-binding transcriptional LysR family regulator